MYIIIIIIVMRALFCPIAILLDQYRMFELRDRTRTGVRHFHSPVYKMYRQMNHIFHRSGYLFVCLLVQCGVQPTFFWR